MSLTKRVQTATRLWLVLAAGVLILLVWFGQRFSLGIDEYYFHKQRPTGFGWLDVIFIALSVYFVLVAATARWRIARSSQGSDS